MRHGSILAGALTGYRRDLFFIEGALPN